MHFSYLAALAVASSVIALPAPQAGPDEGDGTISEPSDIETATNAGSTGAPAASATSAGDSFTLTGEDIFPTATGEPAVSSTGSMPSGVFPTSIPTSSPSTPDLQECGSALYSEDEYTCYDGFLCPVVDGTPTVQCGDACYLSSLYSCEDGALVSSSDPAASGVAPSGTGGGGDFTLVTQSGDSVPTATENPDPIITGIDVLPTATGSTIEDVLPTATGESSATSTGGSSATGNDAPFPTATGDSIPSGMGDIFPTATGDSSATATGASSATGDDVPFPTAVGESIPSGMGDIFPTAAGPGAEDIFPTATGGSSATATGDSDSESTATGTDLASQPSSTGSSDSPSLERKRRMRWI
ncbi:MAG: hypothetical protein Q9219_001599 [cf. Caloplaca sp. 3 TL-2023]